MSFQTEALSEVLIAQLLEEDLKLRTFAVEAERLQFNEIDPSILPQVIDDGDFALALLAADARVTSDAAYVQSLQVSEEASFVASRQYAQTVAAAERKLLLDSEFAKRLQDAEDAGKGNEKILDDAQSVLGRDAVAEIMASDLNDVGYGKGKAKARIAADDDELHGAHGLPPEYAQSDISTSISSYIICGICREPFQETQSPISASSSANSSSCLAFGLRLPCPEQHPYCIDCLSCYIRHKLEPDGGIGDTVIFPIRCPECPIHGWADGITDDVAQRILSKEVLLIWYYQKLLDSIPRYYCPNPRCSVLLELPEESDDPRSVCPHCEVLICVSCRVEWHQNLTCAAFQALPQDERSPEDQMVLRLAKVQNWRRCPKCAHIIELTVGCNHILCVCKAEFCFRCQALWDKKTGRCSRDPACELWDEEMLLETRERERDGQQPQAMDPPPVVPLRPAPLFVDTRKIFADIFDNGTIDSNRFTTAMVRGLTCGYCHVRLTSVADLRYHLRNVRRHHVFVCCGQLFQDRATFDEHVNSPRFELHVGQYVNGR